MDAAENLDVLSFTVTGKNDSSRLRFYSQESMQKCFELILEIRRLTHVLEEMNDQLLKALGEHE